MQLFTSCMRWVLNKSIILHLKKQLGLLLQHTLSHPNPINPPHAPIGSFEKDILMSRIQCYSTGCTMHERIQKIMSGGLGVLKTLFKFFHRRQSGPGLLFEAIGPKGSYFFSRLSITVFLRKHITTCDLPGGMQTLCPPPSVHAHAMLS